MKIFIVLAVLFGLIAQANAQFSSAVVVDDQYNPHPLGKWKMVQNFVDADSNGRPSAADAYRFPAMADPTGVSIDGWYYFCGTFTASNFAIYRTQDFENVSLYMHAFYPLNDPMHPSGQWTDSSSGIPSLHVNGNYWTQIWAPQLVLV